MSLASETPATSATGETYAIGAPVRCEDGPCGELGRVVVDPVKRTVTHLVIEPHHRHARARLVPVSLVDATGGDLRVRCTLEMFRALQHAQETELLPAGDPWVSAGAPGAGMSYPAMLGWPHYSAVQTTVTHERVPLDQVEIRRGEPVHADGVAVGRVHGLVVDPAGDHVTHVLLQEGHLWGVKDVAIPIGAITRIDGDGVHVSLSKPAIAALPQIDLAMPADVRAGKP